MEISSHEFVVKRIGRKLVIIPNGNEEMLRHRRTFKIFYFTYAAFTTIHYVARKWYISNGTKGV